MSKLVGRGPLASSTRGKVLLYQTIEEVTVEAKKGRENTVFGQTISRVMKTKQAYLTI